jgi:Phage tail tube protein, GTA-gp10
MLGEVRFEADGRVWVLAYSVNALIEIEQALGVGVAEIAAMFADPGKLRLGTLRTVFRCGLVDHHPEVGDGAAGRIMTALGLKEASDLVGRAMAAAFPPAETSEAAGPFDSQAGAAPHGSRSTGPGASSPLPLTPSGA